MWFSIDIPTGARHTRVSFPHACIGARPAGNCGRGDDFVPVRRKPDRGSLSP